MKTEPVAGTSKWDQPPVATLPVPALPIGQPEPQPQSSSSTAVPKRDMDSWQRVKLIKLPSAKETGITRAIAYHNTDDMWPKSFRYCMVIAILLWFLFFYLLFEDENHLLNYASVNYVICINFGFVYFRHLLHVCKSWYVPPSKNTML